MTDTKHLLAQAQRGESDAVAELLGRVYAELREIAGRLMARERAGHTLTPTALVHEAAARLLDKERVDWQGRTHLVGYAAVSMRRILVDYARARAADKRLGRKGQARLETSLALSTREAPEPLDVLAVDEALQKLQKLSPRQARLAELRFFGGLTSEEAAEVLGVSLSTVEADWRMARTWLHRELSD